MATDHPKDPWTPLSQRELDLLRVLGPVREGKRSHAEAARLLGITPRHVRRLLDRLEAGGDAAIAHRLRGRPANRQADADLHARILQAYRTDFADFGPTWARAKRAERSLHVGRETLRRWLIA